MKFSLVNVYTQMVAPSPITPFSLGKRTMLGTVHFHRSDYQSRSIFSHVLIYIKLKLLCTVNSGTVILEIPVGHSSTRY